MLPAGCGDRRRAAYALSPIDLIPDFIPVLGYLDEVVIVAIWLAALALGAWHAPQLLDSRTTVPGLAGP